MILYFTITELILFFMGVLAGLLIGYWQGRRDWDCYLDSFKTERGIKNV